MGYRKVVLHCIATLEGGGAERQLCYLAKGLVEQGWDVHVAILKRGTNYQRLMASGAVVHELCVEGNYTFSISKQLIRIIKETKPAVVQCWQRPMDVFAGLAALYTRVPFISVERTSPAKYAVSFKGFLKFCIAQFCSANVSNSVEGKEYWDKWLLRKVPNEMIPNIVPFDEMPFVEDPAKNADTILVVSRLAPEKNISILIEAISRLPAHLSGIQLNIIGTGEEKENLANKIASLQLENAVFIHGFRENAWEWISKAKLFVSLSLYEGMPNAVMEAAGIGIPMLLSSIPAHTLFFNKTSASFSDPGSVDEVAAAITNIFESYGVALEKARTARESIKHNSRTNISNSYIRLYERTMQG